MLILELVWPVGLMGWCEQKNNQKTWPGSKILTLEIAGFNPGPTRIEHSVNRNRWLQPGLPEVGNLTCCWNWPKRVLCIACLIPCNFLRLLARCHWCFRRIFTSNHCCIDTRHDEASSQVIDTKLLTSGFNMPIYRCRLKPDKFHRASVNRTSDPGSTHINSGPGSEALVWTWPKRQSSNCSFLCIRPNINHLHCTFFLNMDFHCL